MLGILAMGCYRLCLRGLQGKKTFIYISRTVGR